MLDIKSNMPTSACPCVDTSVFILVATYTGCVMALSDEVIRSVFVGVDPRFESSWDIPYERVRDSVRRMSDDYWAQHPGAPRSGGGLVCLVAPSMDEYVLETERIARDLCVEA